MSNFEISGGESFEIPGEEAGPARRSPPWMTEHAKLYLKDPKKAHMWDSTLAGGPGPMATLLLIVRGRKSGKLRAMPLLYGLRAMPGNGYVIVGSKGGYPTHPHWYQNLQATPECEVRVGARRVRARARTTAGEERSDLWTQMQNLWPPYEVYQQRAGKREIPVVVLDVTEELAPG